MVRRAVDQRRRIAASYPCRAQAGQRQEDSGLGSLYDFQARFYSPALGRFLSVDTLVPSASDPQQLNRYAYARGNPVRYTDPTGHYIFEETPDDRAPLPAGVAHPGGMTTEPNVFMDRATAQRVYGINARVRLATTSWIRDTGHRLTDAQFIGYVGGAYLLPILVALGGELPGIAYDLLAPGAVKAGSAVAATACADNDCTNEMQAVDRFLHYVGPDKIQQSGEAMSGAFKDPRMSVFSQNLGVTAQDVCIAQDEVRRKGVEIN